MNGVERLPTTLPKTSPLDHLPSTSSLGGTDNLYSLAEKISKGYESEEDVKLEESYRLLAAFLTLPRTEQKEFLALGHDEMAKSFQELVPRKRKVVQHVQKSPQHKRTCRSSKSCSVAYREGSTDLDESKKDDDDDYIEED